MTSNSVHRIFKKLPVCKTSSGILIGGGGWSTEIKIYPGKISGYVTGNLRQNIFTLRSAVLQFEIYIFFSIRVFFLNFYKHFTLFLIFCYLQIQKILTKKVLFLN